MKFWGVILIALALLSVGVSGESFPYKELSFSSETPIEVEAFEYGDDGGNIVEYCNEKGCDYVVFLAGRPNIPSDYWEDGAKNISKRILMQLHIANGYNGTENYFSETLFADVEFTPNILCQALNVSMPEEIFEAVIEYADDMAINYMEDDAIKRVIELCVKKGISNTGSLSSELTGLKSIINKAAGIKNVNWIMAIISGYCLIEEGFTINEISNALEEFDSGHTELVSKELDYNKIDKIIESKKNLEKKLYMHWDDIANFLYLGFRELGDDIDDFRGEIEERGEDVGKWIDDGVDEFMSLFGKSSGDEREVGTVEDLGEEDLHFLEELIIIHKGLEEWYTNETVDEASAYAKNIWGSLERRIEALERRNDKARESFEKPTLDELNDVFYVYNKSYIDTYKKADKNWGESFSLEEDGRYGGAYEAIEDAKDLFEQYETEREFAGTNRELNYNLILLIVIIVGVIVVCKIVNVQKKRKIRRQYMPPRYGPY